MKIDENNIEMSTIELLFLITLVQDKCLNELYFGPHYTNDPVLSALNIADKTYSKVKNLISSNQANQIIDLVFEKLDRLNDMIGTYDNVQTVRPQKGVPLWSPKNGSLQK